MTPGIRARRTERQRVPRGEANVLARTFFSECVGMEEGQSYHVWGSHDTLGFRPKISPCPIVEFRGYDFRGRARLNVLFSDDGLVCLEIEPRIFVEPGLFTRRSPIVDYKGRPTVTEAEFVTEIAPRYRKFYADVVSRAEGLRGTLPRTGKGVAALKASAFVAVLEKARIPPLEWTPEAEKAALSDDPAEAEEIRRIVNSESVAAMIGNELMRGPKRPFDLR